MSSATAKKPTTMLGETKWTRVAGGHSKRQCGQVSDRGGRRATKLILLFPFLPLSSVFPTINSLLLLFYRVDLRVLFTMLAARNFSAARQCLRSVRVAPSFVAPVSQVPICSPPLLSETLQLANWNSPDVRFVAMLPLPMKLLPSSRVRRALMYVRKLFPPVRPVRAAAHIQKLGIRPTNEPRISATILILLSDNRASTLSL